VTREETVMLCRYVKACCPQQAIDDFTPDAWHDLLGDLTLADCRAAVMVVGKRQPFVAPAEIRAEVRRQRADRLSRNPLPAPPAELTDDQAAYKRWLDGQITSIANGHSVNQALGDSQRPRPLAIVSPKRRAAEPPPESVARADTAREVLNRLEDFGAELMQQARAELGDVDATAILLRAAQLAAVEPPVAEGEP